jgi:hypothetical protein
MANLNTNPTSYQFLCVSFVLADSDSDNWTAALASDKVDELDKVFRQVVRNNTASLTTCNLLNFGDGFSVRRDVNFGGSPYITEERTLIAELRSGAT